MVPFIRPKISGRSSATGTRRATGLPRFVITIWRRCWWTSSSSLRHLALNSPAGISVRDAFAFMTSHFTIVIFIGGSDGGGMASHWRNDMRDLFPLFGKRPRAFHRVHVQLAEAARPVGPALPQSQSCCSCGSRFFRYIRVSSRFTFCLTSGKGREYKGVFHYAAAVGH